MGRARVQLEREVGIGQVVGLAFQVGAQEAWLVAALVVQMQDLAVHLEPRRRRRLLRARMVEDHRQSKQACQALAVTLFGLRQQLPFLARELASVGADQEGQQALFRAREAGQIRVLEQIGAVAMELTVRDRLADLVHPGGPLQIAATFLIEPPVVGDLGEQRLGRGGHIVGLANVDGVVAGQGLQAL